MDLPSPVTISALLYYVVNAEMVYSSEDEGNLEAHTMKGVASGAHLPTPWSSESAKRPDDRADYCSFKCYYDLLIRMFLSHE